MRVKFGCRDPDCRSTSVDTEVPDEAEPSNEGLDGFLMCTVCGTEMVWEQPQPHEVPVAMHRLAARGLIMEYSGSERQFGRLAYFVTRAGGLR
jgi:hypothetical protein